MHLCLHWMVFFIVHDIFDLAGQYTCIHDHAWPWYKCIFPETVFLAPGWSILHCVCAGSLIDLDLGPEKCNLPKAEAGFEQRCDWSSTVGFCNEERRSIMVSWSIWRTSIMVSWEGEASQSPGPDEGIDRVQKAGKECAPLSLRGRYNWLLESERIFKQCL